MGSSQTAVIVETSWLYFQRGPIGFWEFLHNHDDNTVITSKAGILQAKASQLWRECQRYQFVKTCFRFWPEVKSGVWSAPAEKQSQSCSSGDARLAPFFHCLMDPFLPGSPHIYWAPVLRLSWAKPWGCPTQAGPSQSRQSTGEDRHENIIV